MHIEHDGRSLWYGTPDAPAPQGDILADSDIGITIGVKPIDAGNKVDVYYRVNQGPFQTATAKWARNESARQAQYFKVHLPAFRPGDVVESLYRTKSQNSG